MTKRCPALCRIPPSLSIPDTSSPSVALLQAYEFRAKYYGAVRVVLREAARFTERWQPCVEFTQDEDFLQGRGPPSLVRLMFQAVFASTTSDREGWRRLAEAGAEEELATVAAVYKRGPIAMREFLSFICLDPEDASEVRAALPVFLWLFLVVLLLGELVAFGWDEQRLKGLERPLVLVCSVSGLRASSCPAFAPLTSVNCYMLLNSLNSCALPNALGAQGSVSPLEDGVVISTIHAAKGLEWDVIFSPRWNDGFLPTMPCEEVQCGNSSVAGTDVGLSNRVPMYMRMLLLRIGSGSCGLCKLSRARRA